MHSPSKVREGAPILRGMSVAGHSARRPRQVCGFKDAAPLFGSGRVQSRGTTDGGSILGILGTKSCHASWIRSPNLRAASLILSRFNRAESSCCRVHRLSIDGVSLRRQQCLYLRPRPQGQGSFLPIFSPAWRAITFWTLPRAACGRQGHSSLARGGGYWIDFFLSRGELPCQINARRARREGTLRHL